MPRPDEFTGYLAEFELRQPRSLPRSRAHSAFPRRFAAVAAMVLFSITSVWMISRSGSRDNESASRDTRRDGTSKPLPPFALARAVLQDPARLDAVLKSASPARLPRFDQPNSALYILARE